jgi:hypothetical protein
MQISYFHIKWREVFQNEQGAVMVEFALWLPLVVIVFLLLIICYSVVEKSVSLTTEVYSELRRECKYIEDHFETDGPLRRVSMEKRKTVIVEGAMVKVLQRTTLPLKTSLVTYAGSWPGRHCSRYLGADRYGYAVVGEKITIEN